MTDLVGDQIWHKQPFMFKKLNKVHFDLIFALCGQPFFGRHYSNSRGDSNAFLHEYWEQGRHKEERHNTIPSFSICM